MPPNEITVQQLLEQASRSLSRARQQRTASDMLPLLVEAQQGLGLAIDETMAEAVLEEGVSLRQAGQLADLSENAVGPRLARTALLGAYATPQGRVTRTSVERARYDAEAGRPAPPAAASPPPPLRFRRRRES